jgi:spore maturation protein CgeB
MITIGFYNQDFLMQKEIIAALSRVPGVRLVVFAIPDVPSQSQAEEACDALSRHNCRLLFTVNDWGIDREEITASFCASRGIIHLNWCADDPFFHSTFHGTPLNPRPNRIDFVTDRGYVPLLRDAGLDAHFLPLATDPSIFAPVQPALPFARTACFVGNSYNRQIEGFAKGNEEFIDGLVPFVTGLLMEYRKNPLTDLSLKITEHIAAVTLPAGLGRDKAVFILKHLVSYFYRKRLIVSLCRSIPGFMVFGDEWWLLDLPREKISTAVGYYINLSQTYQQTKINIDVNRVVIREGLTQRVFDCLASGSFVVTSTKSVLPEFFETQGGSAEVVMFENEEHLRELIDHYAAHEDERAAIVERGRKRVLAEHTYDHRIQTIFKTLSSIMGRNP